MPLDVSGLVKELTPARAAGVVMQSFPGTTLPQNFIGTVQLLRALAQHPIDTTSSLRIDPANRAILYDSPNLKSPAAAMGSFVQVNPAMGRDPETLKHELRHVQQSDLTGPAYLPGAISEWLGGEEKYGAGPLENDAIRHATPQAADLLKRGNPNDVRRALLLALLGP
jgi:hypothetical protein